MEEDTGEDGEDGTAMEGQDLAEDVKRLTLTQKAEDVHSHVNAEGDDMEDEDLAKEPCSKLGEAKGSIIARQVRYASMRMLVITYKMS